MVCLSLPLPQVQLNAGQLQYIRLAQPVSGTQVVQGQIQTLATNAQQVRTPEMRSGVGFWLERSAQHTTIMPPCPSARATSTPCTSVLHRKGQVGFFGEDCIQSVSLTVLFSRDKEMQGREISGILKESLMCVHVCLTRGSSLTDCSIVRLSSPSLNLNSRCVLAPPMPSGKLT